MKSLLSPENQEPLEGKETHSIEPNQVSIRGLVGYIKNRIEESDKIVEESRKVFTESEPYFNSARPFKQDVRLVWNKDSKSWDEMPVYPRLRFKELDYSNYPETEIDRKRVARIGKRISRAQDIRSGAMFRMRQTWGEDLGTDEFKNRIRNTRSRLERRRLKAAQAKYNKLAMKAQDLAGNPKIEETRLERSKPAPEQFSQEQMVTFAAISEGLRVRPRRKTKKEQTEEE